MSRPIRAARADRVDRRPGRCILQRRARGGDAGGRVPLPPLPPPLLVSPAAALQDHRLCAVRQVLLHPVQLAHAADAAAGAESEGYAVHCGRDLPGPGVQGKRAACHDRAKTRGAGGLSFARGLSVRRCTQRRTSQTQGYSPTSRATAWAAPPAQPRTPRGEWPAGPTQMSGPCRGPQRPPLRVAFGSASDRLRTEHQARARAGTDRPPRRRGFS